MERSTPARKSRTSTADLLVWIENQPEDPPSAAGPGSRPDVKSHQPSDGVSKVLFGGQLTEEEAQNILKRKTCSGSKLKEMTGSGIFVAPGEDDSGVAITPNGRPGLRLYQQASSAISQISFSNDGSVSPKKPASLAEIAKQRELSGNLDNESEAKMKQLSEAKCKELSGNNIFGPPEIPVKRRSAVGKDDLEEQTARNTRSSVNLSNPSGVPSNLTFSEEVVPKTARKIHEQKYADLSGNDIFKGEATPGSVEKTLSVAKLREISGSNIFADEKVAARDYLGGVRKPPGGESSIALV